MLNILNLGAGRQSSYLYHASGRGILPKIDLAIFSDTGDERQVTYNHLNWLIEEWSPKYDIPIVVVGNRNIVDDVLRSRTMSAGYDKAKGERWAAMPWFVKNPKDGSRGMIRRQCTNEYKIMVIDKYIKTECLGLKLKGRWPTTHSVRQWFGISSDEYHRMRKPVVPRTTAKVIGKDLHGDDVTQRVRDDRPQRWRSTVYPLCSTEWKWNEDATHCDRIDLGFGLMSVADCIQWHRDNDLPDPPSSACKKCPYRDNAMWREMRDESPEEFAEACDFDDAIRVAGGMKGETFSHADMVPLRVVNLDDDGGEGGLFACDGGVCGT